MLIRICTQATDSVTWLDKAWDLGDWILSWVAADLDRCQDLALETCFAKHHTPRLSRLTADSSLEHPIFSCRSYSRSLSDDELRQKPKGKKKKRSPKNVQRAWAGSSSIHCSDMSQLHHWARLSSVSSDTLSLRALETGINNKNNNSLTTIAGKSVYEDMWVKVSLIPYPTLSSLGVMLARTLFLQQEYMYFGKWVFFFLLFLAPGLKVF